AVVFAKGTSLRINKVHPVLYQSHLKIQTQARLIKVCCFKTPDLQRLAVVFAKGTSLRINKVHPVLYQSHLKIQTQARLIKVCCFKTPDLQRLAVVFAKGTSLRINKVHPVAVTITHNCVMRYNIKPLTSSLVKGFML
ncbi:hypothetical protein, partial [Nonlabens sp.]|uniref:hypothetical protein n=1 Tax=Nonlabens sp. TaxID=1888209 RepID=UPI0025F1086B